MPVDRTGQCIGGRYTIVGILGVGAFGTVYEAKHGNTGQLVALKLLHLGETLDLDERRQQSERFARECQLCAELTHPHIVRLLDSGELDGVGPYLVFEKVKGQTLAQLLEAGTLGIEESLWIMTQVLDALSCAHRNSILHRDIKPQNIMVNQDGLRPNAIVLDFGMGGFVESLRRSRNAITLTRDGGLGTPAYAAREQLKGLTVGAEADLYSWGLVFLECLQGSRVVPGNTFEETLYHHLGREEHKIDDRILSSPLGKLLAHVVQKVPSRRPRSAEEIYRALLKIRALQPPVAVDQVGEETFAIDPTAWVPRYRRQVTILAGILRLRSLPGADSDAERLDQAFQRELLILLRRAQETGAFVVSVLADKFILLIGYPDAQEDAGTRALELMMTLRELTDRRSEQLAQSRHLSIDLRLAVNTGMTLVPLEPRHVSDFGGQAYNIATRLCAEAGESESLIASGTFEILSASAKANPTLWERIALKARGEVDLGLGAPVAYHALRKAWREQAEEEDEDEALSSSLATLEGIQSLFIGRKTELQTLSHLWEESQRGMGQCVLILGEAGLGKSRLLKECARRLEGQADQIIHIQASQERQTSFYHPLVVFLHALFAVRGAGDTEDISERVLPILQELDMNGERWLPIVADLLTLKPNNNQSSLQLSPSLLKERRQDFLLTLFAQLAETGPILLRVEDIQWADPMTLDVLGALVEELPSMSLLCVMSARPDFSPPWDAALSHQIKLSPLSTGEVEQMIDAQIGLESLPPKVLEQLQASADGIPLFVEELTQTAIELMRRGLDLSQARETRGSRALGIPSVLFGGLMARLDKLETEAQRIARVASVVGREFGIELLAKVVGLSIPNLRVHLKALQGTRLLYRVRARPRAETYVFKHALLQQIAYDSLPMEERVTLHLRVAETLEKDFADVQTQEPGILRYHFHLGEDYVRAIRYTLAVAQEAQRVSAEDEAVALLREGLSWLKYVEDPEAHMGLELELNATLLPSLSAVAGFGAEEMGQVLDHLGQLVEGLEHIPDLFPLRWARWNFLVTRGEHEEALRLAEENLAIARRIGDSMYIMEALTDLGGGTLQVLSRNEEARAALEEAWTYMDTVDGDAYFQAFGQHKGVSGSIMMASLQTRMGALTVGERWAERALAVSRELGHVHSQGIVLGMLSEHLYARGDLDGLVNAYEALLKLSERYGLPFWEGLAAIPGQWARLRQGRGDLTQLRAAHSAYVLMGMKIEISLCSALVADGALYVGELNTALAWVDRALGEAEALKERTFESDIHRVKGDILRARGNLVGARTQYELGLAQAERQGDRIFALTNAHHLAELLSEGGEGDAARQRLAPVVAAFDGQGSCPRLSAAQAFLATL